MTSGQSPALSLGSLCDLTPSLQVFWDRGPNPSSFSPHKGREVRAEKSTSWASGGGLPSWLFTAKKKTLAGLETLPPLLLYSAASCVVRVEGAFPLITQQGRSHPLAGGGGGHATEGSLPACRSAPDGACDKPAREGHQRDLCLGKGAASQKHLLKLKKGSQPPCLCCGNRERDGRFSRQSRVCRPVS